MTNNKLGFTLTELLAVVLIIGILTSIGLRHGFTTQHQRMQALFGCFMRIHATG